MKTAFYLGLAALAASWACSSGGSAVPGGAGSPGPVSGPNDTTNADGGASPDGATVTPNGVTYYKDLLPILQDHCQKCHTQGGIAPFSLTSYDDAKGAIGMMVDVTQRRVMPPWGAQDTPECTPPRPWKEDMRLSDAQIATIKAWRDGGTVEGDPNDAPPPRAPGVTDLPGKNFTSTNKPYAIQTTKTDTFRCFVVDPQLTTTRYYNGSFFIPGNKEIVHHIVLFADPKNESAKLADANGQYDCFGGPGITDPSMLAVWVPGSVPTELPSNAGAALDPGTRLVMQIHYHPHGQDFTPDATTMQLRLVDAAPEYTALLRLIGNYRQPNGTDGLLPGPDDNGPPVFRIPANVSGHTETMRFTFPASTPSPLYVYDVGAHMHLVGTDEKVTIDHTSGSSECMLQVPAWNFNWQRLYTYDVPIEQLPVVAAGDKMTVRCTYDNTMGNPFLAAELSAKGLSGPRDVSLGETTDDEMCLGATMFLYKAK